MQGQMKHLGPLIFLGRGVQKFRELILREHVGGGAGQVCGGLRDSKRTC